MSDEDIQRTLPYLPPVVSAMVQLQRRTGARPEEICSLAPAHVDRSGEVWIYRPPSHKNQHRGMSRSIYIGPQGQQILGPFLERPADVPCFSPAESEAGRRAERSARRITPLHHGNRPGTNRRNRPNRQPAGRYTVASYRRAIQRACEAAKIIPWSPNQLRHAAATEARKKFGLDAAQAVLGHGRASTTEIYAEVSQQKLREFVREMG